MKVYLDTNIVSAIAKDDEPAESDALDRLLTARRKGKVDLVTSELTLAEIKRYQDTRRRADIERIFQLLEKVEIVRWDELVGMHSYGDERTWINTPIIQNDPVYTALLAIGLGRERRGKPQGVDAQHVFVAVKHKCDVFLTLDKRVLRHAPDIQKQFGLVVHKPSNFVARQGWGARMSAFRRALLWVVKIIRRS